MKRTVMVHAFRNVNGGTEHADWDDQDVAGFCVYLRTENPKNLREPFRVSHETDFHVSADDDIRDRQNDAMSYAEWTLAQRFECIVDQY